MRLRLLTQAHPGHEDGEGQRYARPGDAPEITPRSTPPPRSGLRSTGVEDLRPKAPTETLVDQAKHLVALREQLVAEEQRLAEGRIALARQELERTPPERITVPEDEWARWFEEVHGGS